jgi:hypothetical protein
MSEKLVDTLVVQDKPGGGFQVTVPKRRVADVLGLKGDEVVHVYFDSAKRTWRYQLNE